MLRRNVRLRKEYLYRKSLEGKERAVYERKRLVKKALEGRFSQILFIQQSRPAVFTACPSGVVAMHVPMSFSWAVASCYLHTPNMQPPIMMTNTMLLHGTSQHLAWP